MILRALKEQQYSKLLAYLDNYAHHEPLSKQYDITLHVGKIPYILRLQPTSHSRVAALQALEVLPKADTGGKGGQLVSPVVLFSLLELFIHQSVSTTL